MIYALINSGHVVNVIIADTEFAESLVGQYDNVVLCNSNAGIGSLWNEVDGFYEPPSEIIEEPIIEEPTEEPVTE